MADKDKPEYTLHYFPFSLYSLMVRFGFALGDMLNPATAPRVKVRLVNLHRADHLSEPFLTLINTKGEVPVLTSPALPSALGDSRDIAWWLCQQQPELLPDAHTETITRLMDGMYSFEATPLVTSAADRPYGIPNEAAARLEKNDLPPRYRRALEIKSLFHESTHASTLEPDNVAEAEEQAKDFMDDLAQVLREHQDGQTWIFGKAPTILDAHAATLAARLFEAGRFDLLPDEVQVYVRGATATPVWESVTHGRPTAWDSSLGEVAEFDVI